MSTELDRSRIADGTTAETILGRVEEAVFAVDDDWQVTFISPQAATILDCDPETMLETDLWEQVPSLIDSPAYSQFHDALEDEEPTRFEMQHRPRDAWYRVRAYPAADGLTVCMEEITEQRKRRIRLQRTRELFQAVFEDTEDALVIADTDRRITDFNPAAERLFGYDESEVLGEQSRILYADESDFERTGAERFNEDASERHDAYVVEYERADGTTFAGETVGTPLHGPDDEALAFLGAIRDVTDRVEHEHALERHNMVLHEFHEIATDDDRPFETQVEAILELGVSALGLDVGLVAAIDEPTYTVEHAMTMDGSITAGETFDLSETLCELVVEQSAPLSVNSAADSDVGTHPAYREAGVKAYLGVPVLVDGALQYTLNFSSTHAREEPFTDTEEMLVRIFAQWLGKELSRQQNEQKAQASRDRLRQVIDILPQLVFAKDEDGEFLLANQAVAEAYGTTVDELEGATDADFADSQVDAEQFRADDRAVIESGESKHIPEEPLTTAEGEQRTFETTKIPYDPVETAGDAVLGISTDITDRKEREAELELQSAAMEASMDGIAILDQDSEYIYMNEAHADVFDYESEELIGSTWKRLYADEEVERLEAEAFPVLERQGDWRGETVGRDRDGNPVYQELTLSLLDDGKLICTNRDIAERREREQALERQRERLRALFDKSPDGIIVHDAEGFVLDANTTQSETLGYDREELLSRNVAEIEVGIDRPELQALWAEMTTGDTLKVEGEHRRQNGETFPVEVWVNKVEVDGNNRYIAVSRDISEQKSREQELERSHNFIEKAQESASIGGWEVDLDDETLRWTDEVYRIHDLPTDADVSIEDGIDFYHPEDKPKIRDAYERLTTEGEPYDLELRIVTANDRVRWVRTVGDPQFDEDGAVSGVLGVFQDITNRKEREQTFREIKERLDLAVEGANLGVWDWNMETDAVTFNKQWAEMLGLSLDEVDPTLETWEQRVHPEDMPRVEEQLDAHLSEETPLYDCEHRMRTAGGDWKWVRDVGEVVERDEEGTPTRAVGIHIDITDRKETEQFLEEERDMFAQGPAVVFKWRNESEWPVEYVSDNVTETFGYTPSQLQSGDVPYADLIHDDDIDRVSSEVKKHSDETTERFSHDPYRMVTSDGEVKWVKDNTKVIRTDGEITHYLGYLVDITERKRNEEQLQTVQHRFERFSEAVPNGFFLVSPDYSETYYMNSATEELYGVSMSDVEGDPAEWTSYIHPEDLDRLREDMEMQTAGNADWPTTQEFRVQHPENGLRWVQARVHPVTDDDGTTIELAGVATDITERRALEDSLRTREESLRELTMIASDTDRAFETKLEEILRLGCERLDLPFGFLNRIEDGTQEVTEAVGSHSLLSAGESSPVSETYCRQTIDHEGVFTVDDALEDGWGDDPAYERFELGCYVGSTIVVNGDKYGTLCFAGDQGRDQTFDQADQAFVELLVQWVSYELTGNEIETKLRGINRTARQLMTATSPDEIAEIAVDHADSVLGLPITGIWQYDEAEDALVPQAMTDASTALIEDQPSFERESALAWEVYTAGEVRVYDDLEAADGRYNEDSRLQSEAIIPLGDHGVVCTGSTESRAFSETDRGLFEVLSATLEAALNRAEREELLRETRSRLQQSNEELEQFAYAASHDLQEPLRTVSSYLTLLERRHQEDLTADAQELVDIAVDGADRMREMIQALLAYSRVDTSDTEVGPTELGDVFERVTRNLEVTISTTDATVTMPDSAGTIRGDESQLVQLFQNLVENGIKYSEGDPQIDVTVEHRDDVLEIAVADDGIGMPPDQLDEIFEVFQRLHTREEFEGTGIGLSLCRKIAERHDGTIQVESEPDEGSTFYVTLPGVADD